MESIIQSRDLHVVARVGGGWLSIMQHVGACMFGSIDFLFVRVLLVAQRRKNIELNGCCS